MTHHNPARPLSALDAIFTRRSVRAFTPQTLDQPTVRALLDAAVQAPAAVGNDPWSFVIVQSPPMLAQLESHVTDTLAREATDFRDRHFGVDPEFDEAASRAGKPASGVFRGAGTLVIICAKPAPRAAADCWLAAGTLMTAASALALGTCPVGAAVPAFNLAPIKWELGIPDEIDAYAAVVIGVAADVPDDAPLDPARILKWL